MALSPRGAKNKGSAGEREAAALLDGWAREEGYDLRLERNLEQTRGGGYDINGVEGLAIEVKRVETMAVTQWWNQATRQADATGEIPFLMYRQNRKRWNFRIRQTIGIGSRHHAGSYTVVDINLDEANAARWFKCYLHATYGEPS